MSIFVITVSHGAVSNSKSSIFIYSKGRSLRKRSRIELFALWGIFTSKLGGRVLDFSGTFTFVKYKLAPCSA